MDNPCGKLPRVGLRPAPDALSPLGLGVSSPGSGRGQAVENPAIGGKHGFAGGEPAPRCLSPDVDGLLARRSGPVVFTHGTRVGLIPRFRGPDPVSGALEPGWNVGGWTGGPPSTKPRRLRGGVVAGWREYIYHGAQTRDPSTQRPQPAAAGQPGTLDSTAGSNFELLRGTAVLRVRR